MYITRFCNRSFITRAFSLCKRQQRRSIIAASAIVLALVMSVFVFNSQLAYAVYVNGEAVGVVKDRTAADAVVENAEKELSDILGYDYSLEGAVLVAADLSTATAEPEELQHAIVSNVDEVCEMYAVKVDGVTVGAMDSEAELRAILDGLLEGYSDGEIVSAGFMQDVTVESAIVSRDITSDADVITMLLDPENSGSDYCLTVETIVSNTRYDAVPYETEYTEDDTMYSDTEAIVTPGQDGTMAITSHSLFVNGELRTVMLADSTVTQEPVTEVVARGTVERPPTASYNEYIWPTDGIITSDFGYRSVAVGSSNHQGIDIAGSHGQSIVAADGGEVIYADWQNGYGNVIKLQHDNGDVTFYAHCTELVAGVGERVARGQEIALMGSTGVSSGTHCHFEIRIDGTPVDPMIYLP